MTSFRFITLGAVAFAIAASACSRSIAVQTTAAPDANFSAFRSFRILATPERRADAPRLDGQDPMLNNSITNRQVRAELATALEQRGYVRGPRNPDFLVAFYVGERAKFDTTYWAPMPYRYGYRGFRNSWAWPYYGYGYGAGPVYGEVRESTQGTLLVDVIDPRTNELVWRGQGQSEVSADPQTFAGQLSKAVDAVVARFPRAVSVGSE